MGIDMKNLAKLICLSLVAILCGCSTQQVRPKIVPAVEVKTKPQHTLGVIGGVEPIYFLPMKTPFQARIDTGAAGSALDVSEFHRFERDGEKWVSFVLVNEENGEIHRFEKKVVRTTSIKRINKHEKRVVVEMDVKFGNEIINAEFSLADREKFEYQALIGRNIISGRAIVDPAISNTLH